MRKVLEFVGVFVAGGVAGVFGRAAVVAAFAAFKAKVKAEVLRDIEKAKEEVKG